MRFQLSHLVVALSFLTTSLAQTNCASIRSNFQLYAPAYDKYAALGPCSPKAACRMYFNATTPTTYFNLTFDSGYGSLHITNDPADPGAKGFLKGFLAGVVRDDVKESEIYFFNAKYYDPVHMSKVTCTIRDAANGDGTCDFLCRAQGSDGTIGAKGLSVLEDFDNLLFLGKEHPDSVPVSVKVVV